MLERAFDHGIRAWFAIFFKQMTLQRPAIDPYSDGAIIRLCGCDNVFNSRLGANITRINP
ncbi:MAG: Uncharacterised protein [Hyphomonas sp. TMED17]|nr:MAG: Uncharacterised protein [Hyphomonas sp. TMED17]